MALSYPASAGGGLLLLGFVLLLTPTGKLPSPGWRWWARAMIAVPLLLLVAVALAPGSVDPSVQVVGGPFEFGGGAGSTAGLAFTTLAVVVGPSLVGASAAPGVERQQLRWVAGGAG